MRPKPAFMKKTRNPVNSVQPVSAAILIWSLVTRLGTTLLASM